MEPFKVYTGLAAVLNRANVDTDQIIPKDFLKSISRIGYGEHLFDNWRYNDQGKDVADFELNLPRYKGATILLTGNNFGCGSSREHAVWAVAQYGFKVLIAPQKKSGSEVLPGFADIFRNNSVKNGLLPIELSEAEVAEMMSLVTDHVGATITIDLKAQTILVNGKTSKQYAFNIDQATKDRLLEGLDDIGLVERYKNDIDLFEKNHNVQMA